MADQPDMQHEKGPRSVLIAAGRVIAMTLLGVTAALSRKSEPTVVREQPSKGPGDKRAAFIHGTDDFYEFDIQREKGRRIGAWYG